MALLALLLGCIAAASALTLEEAVGTVTASGTRLDLSGRRLGGSMPPGLGLLTNFTYLNLSCNAFVNSIPPEIGNLTQLRHLDLSNNSLSGLVPSGIGNLLNLRTLNLSNNILNGPIPPELGNSVRLGRLYLFNNSLSGPVPPQLGGLSNLEYLNVSRNRLSGPIPPELGNLRFLRHLSLHDNQLSGALPPELGNLSALTRLYLYNNSLYGIIPPELGQTPIYFLYLYDNDLSGPIPASLADAINLYELCLQRNRLSGAIPPSFSALVNLATLDLQDNQLSGPIPPELGELASLEYLWLSGNELSGSIPPELRQLSNLFELEIHSNSLSGSIPLEFGNLTSLFTMDLHNNSLSGTIPRELGLLGAAKNGLLSSLDLSSNILSGPIPPELGDLYNDATGGLWLLDLHDNHLSGRIPPELGKLQLTTLDLSNNSLSGPIPPELGNIKGVESVYLENNDLVGPIPDELLRSKDLISFGYFSPLSPEIRNFTSLRFLCLGYPGASARLDLFLVPATCQYVQWVGQPLTDIGFWDACSSQSGCAVNLIGSGSKLSQKARRKSCLGKISVFLAGDPPAVVSEFYIKDEVPITSAYLSNNYGNYFLNSSSFLNDIDLGPDGVAYTGVGFTKVQEGNLCGNPEATRVVSITYGVFAGSVLLSTITVWAAARRSGRKTKRRTSNDCVDTCKAIAKSGWGILASIIYIVDLVTDILVLSAVWGAWPMWVVLGSILAPFLVAAFLVAPPCASLGRFDGRFRLRWIWPLPPSDALLPVPRIPRTFAQSVMALLLAPVNVLVVALQDVSAILNQLGLHLVIGEDTYSMESYQEARVLMELVFESIPQAAFQTTLYLLGSSRATRIYIDERIFVQSIGISLLSVVLHYSCTLWEALYKNVSLWEAFRARVKHGVSMSIVIADGRNVELLSIETVQLSHQEA